MTIKIVTDSVSDVPDELVKKFDITVVPAYINIGEASYQDGVDLTREDFYNNLANYPTHPTTAAPASGQFAALFDRLGAAGATDIISIHISAAHSALYNSARLGAEAAQGVRVHTLDSGQLSTGSGHLAIAAAEAAAAGRDVDTIMTELAALKKRTRTIATFETLEFLRRSGRVNWAQAGLGALLQVKPILLVQDGEIHMIERVRTRKRSLQRLVEKITEMAPLSRLTILHANAAAEAADLKAAVAGLVPAGEAIYTVSITPGLGVHVGPGAVGASIILEQNNNQ